MWSQAQLRDQVKIKTPKPDVGTIEEAFSHAHHRSRSRSQTVDEKVEHTGLGNLLSSCACPNLDEMWACQSV